MRDPETKKLHLAYKNMLDRCYNPRNASYKNYGARGIAVCREWLDSRDAFEAWARNSGHAIGLSLDRINTDEGYAPGNCRWATQREQLLNQRRNRIITHQGVALPLAEWAVRLGISSDALQKRLDVHKVPLEVALTPGRLHQGRHGTRTGYEIHGCRCDECRTSNTARHRARRLAQRVSKEE